MLEVYAIGINAIMICQNLFSFNRWNRQKVLKCIKHGELGKGSVHIGFTGPFLRPSPDPTILCRCRFVTQHSPVRETCWPHCRPKLESAPVERTISASETQEAACPHCQRFMTLTSVFDNCVVAWPSRSVLHFECPDCGRFSPIHAVDGQISLGELDGAPGPCFIPQSQVGNQ